MCLAEGQGLGGLIVLRDWGFLSSECPWLDFLSPDNYVHRLVASKTDGKIVQYECEGDMCQEEKIDALQLEVNIFTCWTLHCGSVSDPATTTVQSHRLRQQICSQRGGNCLRAGAEWVYCFFSPFFLFFFLSLSLALQSRCSAVRAGCGVVLWSLVIEEELLVLLQTGGTGGRSGSESLPRPFLLDLWPGFRARICVELSIWIV